MTDQLFLTDFGLAKDTATGSKFTKTGETLGTPSYMSPEQARGELDELTPASDVWALGCVLYELLTNRKAFDGDTPAAIIGAVLTGRVESPQGVPAGPVELVRAALQRPPERRPATAGALGEDAVRVLDGLRPQVRPRRLPPSRVALIAFAGVLIVFAFTWSWWPKGREATVLEPDRSKAERLAHAGWERRQADPKAAEEHLVQACALAPNRHDWQVRLGVLLWSRGAVEAARERWGGVPESDPAWAEAQLYLGLEPLFRMDGVAARPWLSKVSRQPGRVGALATAALAMADGRWDIVRAELRAQSGWVADLMLAYTEGHAEQGDVAQSIDRYRRALHRGPRFAWAYVNLCLAHSRRDDYASALAAIDHAIALEPSATAFRNRGLCRIQLGNLDGALEDFDVALRLLPREPELLYNRGDVHLRQGRYEAAIADYTAVLAVDANHVRAVANRGVAYQELGRRRESMEDFARAVVLDPGDATQLANLGFSQHALGMTAEALASFRAALALEQRAATWVGVGNCLGDLGRATEALAAYDRAVALDTDHAKAWAQRARALRALRDPKGAIADLDRAIALGLDTAGVYRFRGELRHEVGELQAAEGDFTAAIDRDPADGRAYYGRARIRAARGDEAGAFADYTEAVRASPRAAQAWVNRANIHRRRGDDALAVADFTRAIELRPRLWNAWYGRGCARQALGQNREAVEDFGRALELHKTEPYIYLQRAQSDELLGNRARAREDIQTALALAPANWPERRFASEMLAKLNR